MFRKGIDSEFRFIKKQANGNNKKIPYSALGYGHRRKPIDA
jgi:hypothetical protein